MASRAIGTRLAYALAAHLGLSSARRRGQERFETVRIGISPACPLLRLSPAADDADTPSHRRYQGRS